MSDRRQSPRKPVDLFFNKFLDGYPYLCRAVDVSGAGVLIDTYSEPEVDADQFPVELRFPDDSETLWLWARRLRRNGKREALEFVSMSDPAKRRLRSFVAQAA